MDWLSGKGSGDFLHIARPSLQADGDEARKFLHLGQQFLQNQKYLEAIERFKNCLAMIDTNQGMYEDIRLEAHYNLALSLYKAPNNFRGKQDEIIHHCDQIIDHLDQGFTMDPNLVKAMLLKCRVLIGRGDHALAKSLLITTKEHSITDFTELKEVEELLSQTTCGPPVTVGETQHSQNKSCSGKSEQVTKSSTKKTKKKGKKTAVQEEASEGTLQPCPEFVSARSKPVAEGSTSHPPANEFYMQGEEAAATDPFQIPSEEIAPSQRSQGKALQSLDEFDEADDLGSPNREFYESKSEDPLVAFIKENEGQHLKENPLRSSGIKIDEFDTSDDVNLYTHESTVQQKTPNYGTPQVSLRSEKASKQVTATFTIASNVPASVNQQLVTSTGNTGYGRKVHGVQSINFGHNTSDSPSSSGNPTSGSNYPALNNKNVGFDQRKLRYVPPPQPFAPRPRFPTDHHSMQVYNNTQPGFPNPHNCNTSGNRFPGENFPPYVPNPPHTRFQSLGQQFVDQRQPSLFGSTGPNQMATSFADLNIQQGSQLGFQVPFPQQRPPHFPVDQFRQPSHSHLTTRYRPPLLETPTVKHIDPIHHSSTGPQVQASTATSMGSVVQATHSQQPSSSPENSISTGNMVQSATQETNAFPLWNTHDFRLACEQCMIPTRDSFAMYHVSDNEHECKEEILMLHNKQWVGPVWIPIRAIDHSGITGKFKLCRHFSMQVPCRVRICQFAHYQEEIDLWTLDRDPREQFNLVDFIASIRSKKAPILKLVDVFKEFGGTMMYICKLCFWKSRITRMLSKEAKCSEDDSHQTSAILCHCERGTGGIKYFLIGDLTPECIRPGGDYLICWHGEKCYNRKFAMCRFTHSPIEQAVWRMMTAGSIVYNNVLEEWKKLSGTDNDMDNSQKQQPDQEPQESTSDETRDAENLQISKISCPYKVEFMCEKCYFQNRQFVSRDPASKRCTSRKNPHAWDDRLTGVCVSDGKVIRKPPSNPTKNFVICNYLSKCRHGDTCIFAHSEPEKNIWNWMVLHSVTSLAELVEISRDTHGGEAAAPVVAPAPTRNAWGRLPTVVAAPIPVPAMNIYYCEFCGVECSSKAQWERHCSSEKHNQQMLSDNDRQWNYRVPPLGRKEYRLCHNHTTDKSCKYSNVQEMYNCCTYAHSQDELEEWKERYKYRQLKLKQAADANMNSYVNQLDDDFYNTSIPASIMCEVVDGANAEFLDTPASTYVEEKGKITTWNIRVTSPPGCELVKVALLSGPYKSYFTLPNSEDSTTVAGGVFKTGDGSYLVEVRFKSSAFGSYMQRLVFDFGSRPVLLCKLRVEVNSRDKLEDLRVRRREIAFDRWTAKNREIVRFEAISEEDEMLLSDYKEISDEDDVIDSQLKENELNRHNYLHVMYKLLQLEEFERSRIIASHNLTTTIEVRRYIDDNGWVMSTSGQLFAKVPLQEEISVDRDAGKLILNSVSKVLLARVGEERRVHEALLVNQERFGFQGLGRDYFYLCLSAVTVDELEIRDGDELNVEIQFQMDRLHFCRMLSAVDNLQSNLGIVYPDLRKIEDTWTHHDNSSIRSDHFNDEQLAVVRYITADHGENTAPLVVYGPFGTGKTSTLAQCAVFLADNKPSVHIMICTHSNSAADLYVDRIARLNKTLRKPVSFCRVFYPKRRNVPEKILPYTFRNEEGSGFRIPSVDDLKTYQIVIITLETSYAFVGEPGMDELFTHILIDEAAQALEGEAIIPLANARAGTCVVLAGDHKQMAPAVYSKFAREKGLDLSLLHRLFRYYQTNSRPAELSGMARSQSSVHLLSPFTMLLSINYRTQKHITRFLSEVFYNGPDVLKTAREPRGDVPGLSFYTANGSEMRHETSTSFFNEAEVNEVVERVSYYANHWPDAWGKRDLKTIAVLAHYSDQVALIRDRLRKRSLGRVYCTSVANIQGLEFNMVFISTVRTQITQASADVDLGFLSDEKLLNTAMTRACEAVAVVGDPVALCSLGDCRLVWHSYLRHCEQHQSLHPRTLSLEMIESEVLSARKTSMDSPVREEAKQAVPVKEDDILEKLKQKAPPSGSRAARIKSKVIRR